MLKLVDTQQAAVVIYLNNGKNMKKICFVIFCMFVSSFAMAGGQYNLTTSDILNDASIQSSWGSPKIGETILEINSDNGKFVIRTGNWAPKCFNDTSVLKHATAVAAMVAHDISEHGAYFCWTGIFAASNGDSRKINFTNIYAWDYQCAWFCEPGYDGDRCEYKLSDLNYNMACNSENYAKMYSDRQDGNVDNFTCPSYRDGVADKVVTFDFGDISGYPHAVVLGAWDFKDHGIIARPMLISRIGNVGGGDDNNYWLPKKPASGGISKTLCAQGYTKNEKCEMSSQNCTNGNANIPFCYYWQTDTTWGQLVMNSFNPDVHVKVPATECVNRDSSGKCVSGSPKQACYNIACKNGFGFGADRKCDSCPYKVQSGYCEKSGHDNFGKCVTCNDGQYFSQTSCECEPVAAIVNFNAMQYGKNNNADCWMLDKPDEYKKCIVGE